MKEYNDLNDYEIMYMVEENDESAGKILYEKYKPIIYSYAKKMAVIGKRYGLEYDDFVQEGYFGLFSAIKKYSTNRNCLFYTYATLAIKSKMNNLIINQKSLKNKTMNESISLDEPINNSQKNLIDYIPDSGALMVDAYIENKQIENYVKDLVYGSEFNNGLIMELKWNGFKYSEIRELLEFNYYFIKKVALMFQKRLDIFIEKNIG